MLSGSGSNSLHNFMHADGEMDKFNTLRLSTSKTKLEPGSSKSVEIAVSDNIEIDDSDDQISEHIAELQSLFPPRFVESTSIITDEPPKPILSKSVIWADRSDLLLDSHQSLELNDTQFTTNYNQNYCSCLKRFLRSTLHHNDPYIRLTLIPTKDTKTTKCIFGVQQNAMWTKSDKNNRKFFIPTQYIDNREPIKMLIGCWNADFYESDEFLGSRVVDVQPGTVIKDNKRKIQVKLRDGSIYKGLLTLNISYTETMNVKTLKQLKRYLKKKKKKLQKIRKKRRSETDTNFNVLQNKSDVDVKQTYGMLECEILTFEAAEANITNLQKYKDSILVIAITTAYILIGSVIFWFLEDWKFINALYFTMVSISSVGYGDEVPTKFASKLFCCVYVTISFLLIFVMVTSFTERIITDRHSKRELRKESEKRRTALMTRLGDEIVKGDRSQRRRKGLQLPQFHSQSKEKSDRLSMLALEKDKHTTQMRRYPAYISYVLLFVIWLLCWIIYFVYFAKVKMDWFEALYFGVITATTVGFGDNNALDNEDRKIFIICWLLIGCASLTNIASAISIFIADKRQEGLQRRVLQSALTTLEDLREFDECNDGEIITRAEFLQGMLLKMQLIDKSVIDRINDKFLEYGGLDGVITLDELNECLEEKSLRL